MKIPLGGTAIKRVNVGGTTGYRPSHVDLSRSRQASDFLWRGRVAQPFRISYPFTKRRARSEHEIHSTLLPNTFWMRSASAVSPSRPSPVPCV